MRTKMITLIATITALVAGTADAAIYTFADFTRPANAASLVQSFDFQPAEGWTNSPPNAISGEASLYLRFTVSWLPASNIGTFQVRFNRADDGSQARWGAGTDGSGFAFITSNGVLDPDGAGPATAKPTVDAVDKTLNTSVTFVLKVNQIQALTNPGGDWWYGTIGQQSAAAGFLYINPNLNASEDSQSTKWAAWRSSQDSYSGVSFISDTAGVDLNFSDIAIYTGDDTPFNPIVIPSPAALPAGLVMLGLIAARRKR